MLECQDFFFLFFSVSIQLLSSDGISFEEWQIYLKYLHNYMFNSKTQQQHIQIHSFHREGSLKKTIATVHDPVLHWCLDKS